MELVKLKCTKNVKRMKIRVQEAKMEIQMFLKLKRKKKAHVLSAENQDIISTSVRVRSTVVILGEVREEEDSSKREEAREIRPNSSETAAVTAEATAVTEAEAQVSEDEAVNNGTIVRAKAKAL